MRIEKLKNLTSLRYKLLPTVITQTEDMGNTFNEVVKAHLVTELCLEELIALALPKASDAFLSLRLTYKQKLDFSSKLYLTDEYKLLDDNTVESLRKLNKMRNNFAHRLGYEVTDEDIKFLYVRHLASAK